MDENEYPSLINNWICQKADLYRSILLPVTTLTWENPNHIVCTFIGRVQSQQLKSSWYTCLKFANFIIQGPESNAEIDV